MLSLRSLLLAGLGLIVAVSVARPESSKGVASHHTPVAKPPGVPPIQADKNLLTVSKSSRTRRRRAPGQLIEPHFGDGEQPAWRNEQPIQFRPGRHAGTDHAGGQSARESR